MRNKVKRLSALGATALVALVVVGPIAAEAQVDTTTTTPTTVETTTTLPEQKTVKGRVDGQNNCVSKLEPALTAGGPTKIGVTVVADLFGQPHLGKQISMTNTRVTISIPATLLQLGVDAGIITDGQTIPSVIKIVLAGDGTTQRTHTYTLNATVTVHVNGGIAEPLTSTFNLPDTTWTPNSIEDDVFFSQKSMLITSTLDLSASIGQIVIATFTCNGTGADLAALGGLGAAATTTTVAPPPTAAPTVATTPVTPAAVVDPGELPRTGSSAGLLFAVAVGLLSAGLFALRATSRRSEAGNSRSV